MKYFDDVGDSFDSISLGIGVGRSSGELRVLAGDNRRDIQVLVILISVPFTIVWGGLQGKAAQ